APVSSYSTGWFTPPVAMVVLVLPPTVPGLLTVLVCWPVMIGTDWETLMTAFLFSDVITCGFEMMFTRFCAASTLSIARNSELPNVKAVSPAPTGPNAAVAMVGMTLIGGLITPLSMVGKTPFDALTLAMPNLPVLSAQSMP